MKDVLEALTEGKNRIMLDPFVYDDGVIALAPHVLNGKVQRYCIPTAVWVGPMKDPNGDIQPLYRPHWNECIRRTGRKKNGDERRATKEFRLAKEAWTQREAERRAHRPTWERKREKSCSAISLTISDSAAQGA